MNARDLGERIGYTIGKLLIYSLLFVFGKRLGRKTLEDDLKKLPSSDIPKIPKNL